MSKFMLLIHSDPAAGNDVDETAMMGEYWAYTQDLMAAGALVAGDPLQGVETAKTVGKGSVTDGPFAETAEQLGGYYIIDVPSIDDAVEWASKVPNVAHDYGHVEVRPLFELPPEMAP